MLLTYDAIDTFGLRPFDQDRASLPLIGFVLGGSISVIAWALVGSIVWWALS
jgi:hypothetical protein